MYKSVKYDFQYVNLKIELRNHQMGHQHSRHCNLELEFKENRETIFYSIFFALIQLVPNEMEQSGG